MNYSRNRWYFRDMLKIVSFILIFGVAIFALELKDLEPVGFFLCALGVGLFLLAQCLTPNDKQYDESVKENLRDLKSRALKKLGIDEDEISEVQPITFGGYDYQGADRRKEGKDKKWRSNVYKAVMIFFSQNEMHCYTLRFKTTEQEQVEETDVFFYQDIVSASTTSNTETITVGKKQKTVNIEAFKLTTKGGNAIIVNLLNAADAQNSVNAMRALLREKKQG